MPPAVLVDAEGAVKAWAIGRGMPASLTLMRSGPGTSGDGYLLLTRVGGTPDANNDHARISATAIAPTKQKAAVLAVAFANAVTALTSGTVLMAGVLCLGADVDSGPSELPDPSGSSRYIVETTFHVGGV